jgi:ABC-type multidrug transport system fused ATPase/permease subunit
MSAPTNIAHEEEALGKAYDTRILRRLIPFVMPYWRQMAFTIVLLFPLLAFELLPAWIVKAGLDEVIVPAATGLAPDLSPPAEPQWVPTALWPAAIWCWELLRSLLLGPEGVSPLAWLAGLYFTVSIGASFLRFLDMWIMARTGQSAMRDVRRVVFAHIQCLHLGFFDTMPVGRLVTRATNDVENVAEMFSAGIVALIRDVIKMLAFAAVLFIYDAQVAATAFVIIPVMAVFMVVFRWKVREAYRAVRVRIARINTYIQENVTGMKVVQLFSREKRNFADFDEMNADHRDAWLKSIFYDAALFSSVEFAAHLTTAVVVWQVAGIEAAGTIYLFWDYLRRFFEPLRDLSAKYAVMQSSMAGAERIFQLLDTEPIVEDRGSALAPERLVERGQQGRVEFDGVWFGYGAPTADDDSGWVLRDMTFSVEPGERVAFVGATGAGKTTVIKLLTRLYDVTRGSIRIDGVDLREWPQSELRRRVSMVLQDVFLFSGSVADNISLERPEINAARVAEVARAVHAHRFIESFPEGYETSIRERASNLSQGQRQLLSFARALAHDGDILVLDEATSSIDTETEALVQEGIHTLMEGRTSLVIAHRLSTIQDVDRIYVLDHGAIREAGSHDELLASGGLYSRLYKLQYATQRGPAAAAS